jgi:uncharacterized protein (DUF3084 family)
VVWLIVDVEFIFKSIQIQKQQHMASTEHRDEEIASLKQQMAQKDQQLAQKEHSLFAHVSFYC